MNNKFQTTIKGFTSLLLAFLLVSLPLIAQTTQASNEYFQGKTDGQRAAKGSPLWILGGFACGLFAVGYCYFFLSPSPPTGALIGKSSEYVLGYTEGYKKKTRSQSGMYSLIGWGIWVVVYLTVFGLPETETY